MKKFTGILARPMPELSSHDLLDEDRQKALDQEKAEREEALIRHFGYSPDDPNVWYDVALSLAELVVPAYMNKQGRPRTPVVRVEAWAQYWIMLRLTGTATDKEAFQIVGDTVGVDPKTVRSRVTKYRNEHPESFAAFEVFCAEFLAKSPDMALGVVRNVALSDDHFMNVTTEPFRFAQGRALRFPPSKDDDFG